jgi:hypothetical protein
LGFALILLPFLEQFSKLLALLCLSSDIRGFNVGLLLLAQSFDRQGSVKGEFLDFSEGYLFAMIIVYGLRNKQSALHDGDLFFVIKQRVIYNLIWFVIVLLAHLSI